MHFNQIFFFITNKIVLTLVIFYVKGKEYYRIDDIDDDAENQIY